MAGRDGCRVKALTPETWDAFAELVERHSGVWNGCWCTCSTTARQMFEEARFRYDRPKGKNNCVMTTTVAPS